MKFKVIYTSFSKVRVPFTVEVKRFYPEDLKPFLITDHVERNHWCTHGVGCPKYDTRPCCPPKAPMFHQLPKRKYFYVITVTAYYGEFMSRYPKYLAAPPHRRGFMFSSTSHKLTRNFSNHIVKLFPDSQPFRSGGCVGCNYPKTKCKLWMPPMEAVGFNLEKLCAAHFEPIDWGKGHRKMMAVVGLYTDTNFKKSDITRIIQEGAKNYELIEIPVF